MYRTLIATTQSQGKKLAIVCIKGYRFLLGPWVGNQCRFYPSCSHYTESAIAHYGVVKGVLLGVWRILRCNPFHSGGYDPIPCDKFEKSKRC